jgi:hypothetical protein
MQRVIVVAKRKQEGVSVGTMLAVTAAAVIAAGMAVGAGEKATGVSLSALGQLGHRPAANRPVPVGKCAPLSDPELARVIVRTWPPGKRVTAFAVARAESGGRPCAVGDVRLQTKTWGPSVCLFQMRSQWAQRGTGGTRDADANLGSPVTCSRHAAQLQAAGGWRHWSVWLHGTYRQYLPAARRALGGRA